MANTFLGMDVSGLLNNLGGEGLTTEERKRAVAFGLLNLGAGTLANNTGNYGQFGPAFGKGMTQGLLGYQAQLGREEAGAKQRRQAKLLSDAFNSSMSQETIPGQVQETQGYDVGGNFSQDMPTAQFMADQGKDINNLMMMQPSKQPKPLETFGLGFPNPPIGQQLPGSRMPFNPNRTQGKPITAPPEPMTEAERELLNMQLAPEGQFDFQKQGGMLTTGGNGSYELPTSYAQGPERWINPADVQPENVVPKTYKTKQPDTLGREQFDMLKAARALMKSGDPQLMQQGFEIYAGLKGDGGEEFGTTPFVDAEGNVVQFGKKGSVRQSGLKGSKSQGESDLSLGVRENLRVKGVDWRMASPKQLADAYKEVQDAQDRRVPKQSVVVNPALDPFKNEQGLRKEYQDDPAVKSAAEIESAFRLIDTAYKNPSPANDLAMATKYMKILDPTSVVRESELAMAMNASGMIDRVFNYANRIATGEKLTESQRKDFYESAKAINDAFKTGVSSKTNKFRKIASDYGLNPDNVVIPPAAVTSPNAESQSFKMLPNATKYSGRTITDQQTGKKYRSDGNKWSEVK